MTTLWQQYLCQACGYIYDQSQGDDQNQLPAGTHFMDLGNDWQCPVCTASKQDFCPLTESLKQAQPTTHNDHNAGVVVIGAGLAGWSVVDAVRALDDTLPITLITQDTAARYHKPMLSVGISQQKNDVALTRQSGIEAAASAKIQLLANTTVLDIDSQNKLIHTTKGGIHYDKLVLAIGAKPIYPAAILPKHAHHINDLIGYQKLYNKLNTSKHIAIVGAGMVGVELAEDLVKAGHQVSLIDKNTYPLSKFFPREVGTRLLNALTELGVQFIKESQVLAVNQDDGSYALQLQSSSQGTQITLAADEIVVATGLSIDDKLLTKAGVAFSPSGITVDPNTLATSVLDIYAIGDCVAILGKPCRYVAPHRPQAAAIAHSITGTPFAGYKHIDPMIRLKNKSLPISATGNPCGTANWQIISDEPQKLVMQQQDRGQIVATVTVGR